MSVGGAFYQHADRFLRIERNDGHKIVINGDIVFKGECLGIDEQYFGAFKRVIIVHESHAGFGFRRKQATFDCGFFAFFKMHGEVIVHEGIHFF